MSDDHETLDDTCPWCGHRIDDMWDYEIEADATTEIECPSCERAIKVHKDVSVTYTMNRAGGAE